MILLCEYSLQSGSYTTAFQLLGSCYRSIRLLALDCPAEYRLRSGDDDPARDESHLRLVWACYTLDEILAAGLPENSSWRQPPKLPLPMSDNDFLSQTPSGQDRNKLGSFAGPAAAHCFSPRAHFVHLASLRSRVLQ